MLDFSFDQKEKDQALQKTRQFFYDDMLAELSAGFDKHSGNLYIDRLEINMGETTEADFSDNFLRVLTEALAAYDAKNIAGTASAKDPMAEKAYADTAGMSVADIILYLRNGYWPWHIQKKTEPGIRLLIADSFKSRSFLLSLFMGMKNDHLIFPGRLTDLVPDNKALQKLFIEVLEYFHPFLMGSGIFSGKFFINKFADGLFYPAFIKKLFYNGPLNDFTGFKNLLFQLLNENPYSSNNRAAEVLPVAEKIKKQLAKPGNEVNFKQLVLLFNKLDSQQNDGQDDEAGYGNFKREIVLIEEKEKINILNAGLVLFHPYLKYVFKELKWVNNSLQFVNKKSRQKAVLFLQFLINGKSRQSEHLLVLNKIICGWPVNLPLETSCNFSAAEKKAAAEMQDSLIEHWSVMKNTSRAGLVKSFVERKGLLQKKDKSFLLQVEKNSIDILLGSLPYGIETIKLPWNEYIIYTEWAY